MEASENKNGRNIIVRVLRSVWDSVFNSGGAVKDCPDRGKTAQDYRDEALKKCPWIE